MEAHRRLGVVMTPDLMPVLSRGKHRTARKGACFMEMASFLAGERWSDHPQCTHPLLASVARMVNDSTSDGSRQQLAGLIPSVIGTSRDDPRWDVHIARRAALTALPIASAERQRVLAVGILGCERALAELETRPLDDVSAESREALADVPDAHRWAVRFSHEQQVPLKRFLASAAPAVVRIAVIAIANSWIVDRDTALRDLLERVIAEVDALAAAATSGAAPEHHRPRVDAVA
jgi:hypothetical protein